MKTNFQNMLYAADTKQENVTPRGMIRSKIAEFKRIELKCRGLAVHTKKIGPILKKKNKKYIYIYIYVYKDKEK